IFFLVVAFVVTCSTMLFATLMSASLAIELTGENLELAAKLTFLNVIFLTLLLTVFDIIRNKITVERPVNRIAEATEQMMQGDFCVLIPPARTVGSGDKFNEIIEYINKMTEELAGMETLRTDFIANVSHELKTPLAVIKNYSTMLLDPSLSEDERCEYVRTISVASQNLSNLISNILKLNKLENQQIYPVAQQYDLGEQLCECLLGFESAWEKKSLEIDTDIEDGVLVESDPEMMTLVWNNLFSNAIKFTPVGGKVTLTLKADKNDVHVSVSDTGCGISPEVGTHIFEKFYQGDASHATQGNGLGLTLVKRVIDITGSDISVESAVGVGTVFTVTMRRSNNEST
ncbi:MAG: HAMP domain-containing histidine kinase, partial [Clostridia bacterium]|nr:HAMP domain-containing histidine kinase [Clostridia bacterium]